MNIIIATQNRAKTQAVTEVMQHVWKDATCQNKPYASDVAEQPCCEQEGIQGAINRARHAHDDNPTADFCVGLEGFVDTNEFGMFLAGAVAIMDKQGKVGIGISAKMQIPEHIQARIEQGEELGPLIEEVMDVAQGEIRHTLGTGGVLTKGLTNRVEEFKHATICALARFINAQMYRD